MKQGIILRHLYFSGYKTSPVGLNFDSGLNIVWGASNTGKSFTLKAIDFCFGKDRLPNIDERKGFDAVWLGLSLPNIGDKTIYRSISGGECLLYDGLVWGNQQGNEGEPVDLNSLILGSIGLDNKYVVKNARGQKQSLTLRTMIHYLLVEEGFIMDESSPIHRGQHTAQTAEKNIFRLFLTGIDDSAIVPSEPKKKHSNASVAAKIELIDEFIIDVETRLGDKHSTRNEIQDQLNRIGLTASNAERELQKIQTHIDSLTNSRREAYEKHSSLLAHEKELRLTIERFHWLEKSYNSDFQRIEGLVEAGQLIATRAGRPCSLCGALPEHQLAPPSVEDIKQQQVAATAELRRIQRDHQDLKSTIASLNAELVSVGSLKLDLKEKVSDFDIKIAGLKPKEAEYRTYYERIWMKRDEVLETQKLFKRIDELTDKKRDIQNQNATTGPKDKLVQGIDGLTSHAFIAIVEEVLESWQFPNSPSISFNDATQDIRVNGKDRRDNGKGVRAILHAAFKVATVLYCHRNDLPHPSFLVLDSPLVAYRDPLKSRYGALSEDEKALKSTRLADHFYEHLSHLSDFVQIIVLENTEPPKSAVEAAKVYVFEGPGGDGREGLFPH